MQATAGGFGWIAAGAALMAACSGGGDAGRGGGDVVVTDSAGVRILEGRSPDRPAPWTAERVGELDAPDGALTAVPWGVAADVRTGRVFVVDWTGNRVLVFEAGGSPRAIGEYGRQGAGPGEFRNPVALAVAAGGGLTVWDAGRGVLSRWTAAGAFAAEAPAPLSYWGPGFVERDGRLATVVSRADGLAQDQLLVELAAGDTVVLHTVRRELTVLDLPCMRRPAPRLFAPDVVWTAGADALYVLHGPTYRIDVIAGGRRTASLRRPVDPVRVTERAAVNRVRLGEYAAFARMCGLTAEHLVAAVGYEPTVAPVQWLAASPDGRLWVTRSTDGLVPDRVDVLDAGGRYEGTLDVPGMVVAFVSPERFVAIAVDPATHETALGVYVLRPVR